MNRRKILRHVAPPWGRNRVYGVQFRQRSTGFRWVGPTSDGSLETALWTAQRMRTAGFKGVRVVILAPSGE